MSCILGVGEMPSDDPRYWFPAKRYGWGWGLPATWEGWAVLLGFFGLLAAGLLVMRPHQSSLAFLAYVMALTIVLTAICWWKGEPPRWRWGDDQ
jgi:drug/metabolite transporter (DMT)-like permease